MWVTPEARCKYDKSKCVFKKLPKSSRENFFLSMYWTTDDEDTGRHVADYFGVTMDALKVLGYTLVEDPQRYIPDDEEITIEGIKADYLPQLQFQHAEYVILRDFTCQGNHGFRFDLWLLLCAVHTHLE